MNTTEVETMSDDPHEFVNNLFASFPRKKNKAKIMKEKDRIEHEYSNLRLIGFKLIRTLCDNIDGLITFVAVLANELMEYSILRKLQKDVILDKDFYNLKELTNTNLMQFSAEVQLDISLMLFIVIAENIH